MQLFVSATGTDIGKTFISSIILSYFQKTEHQWNGCKPLMSGVTNWQDCDACELLKAMLIAPTEANIRVVSPWIFERALSPHRAAELDNIQIDYDVVRDWCKNWLKDNPNGLIEGAGGVYVPINYEKTQLDLMADLRIPVILICGDYLGTISHSLTALKTLHERNIELSCIIINQSLNCVDHGGSKRSIAAFSPYQNVPIFSFMRVSAEERAVWNDAKNWRNCKIYQENQKFFAYLDGLV